MKLEQRREEMVMQPDGAHTATVIWLHGLGADGNDFVPIVPELRLRRGNGVRFIFPHAPVRPVTLNGGVPMRAWYDILALDANVKQDAAGIRASSARIRGYIDAEMAAGVPAAKIVLCGFSQGGAIALHTGVRLDAPLAGVVGLSTYMPLHETLEAEASPLSRQTPLFLAHGRADPVVAYAWGESTARGLQQRGYSVEWKSYPMGHEVCADEIDDLARWLSLRLQL